MSREEALASIGRRGAIGDHSLYGLWLLRDRRDSLHWVRPTLAVVDERLATRLERLEREFGVPSPHHRIQANSGATSKHNLDRDREPSAP